MFRPLNQPRRNLKPKPSPGTIPQKNQPSRNVLPGHLERVLLNVEPENIDTRSATQIGIEVTDVPELRPDKIFVRRIERPKYRTSAVNAAETTIVVATVPARFQPIPKSNVCPALLAHILISKFEDHFAPAPPAQDVSQRQNRHAGVHHRRLGETRAQSIGASL